MPTSTSLHDINKWSPDPVELEVIKEIGLNQPTDRIVLVNVEGNNIQKVETTWTEVLKQSNNLQSESRKEITAKPFNNNTIDNSDKITEETSNQEVLSVEQSTLTKQLISDNQHVKHKNSKRRNKQKRHKKWVKFLISGVGPLVLPCYDVLLSNYLIVIIQKIDENTVVSIPTDSSEDRDQGIEMYIYDEDKLIVSSKVYVTGITFYWHGYHFTVFLSDKPTS